MDQHLRICSSDKNVSHSNIFALGDVAETGAPKMARAAMMQGEVVVDNILNMIKNGGPSTGYRQQSEIEGSIKLTLGIVGCHHSKYACC